MLKLVEFDENLNLQSFYDECTKRGLINNNSQKKIYDNFKKYDKFQTWVLIRDNNPVGSVVAHSFDDYKPSSFRILARTCVLSDKSNFKAMGTVENFKKHQHITARYFLPKCIEWCGVENDMYITTHAEKTGKMSAVHRIVTNFWKNKYLIQEVEIINYRKSLQTLWKLNTQKFLNELKLYPPDKMNGWLNI